MKIKKCYIVALSEEVDGLSELEGMPIFYSGIGKLNVGICMMEVINKGYTKITNIGSCGSKQHNLGELLKVGKVFQDIDLRPICDYGVLPNEKNNHITLDKKSNISCFTTDYFFDYNDMKKYSKEYLEMINLTSIVDMECYSLKSWKTFWS